MTRVFRYRRSEDWVHAIYPYIRYVTLCKATHCTTYSVLTLASYNAEFGVTWIRKAENSSCKAGYWRLLVVLSPPEGFPPSLRLRSRQIDGYQVLEAR